MNERLAKQARSVVDEGALPLAGVSVLDLSRLLPGPYCSWILASYGAEVVKIERPGDGDWLRYLGPKDPETGESLLFNLLNRGKTGLTLNLKSREGRDIFARLAEQADVVLESFRPGVMERLGLNYDRLAERNPGLVYCSLTGYGSSGAYRERAGHDLNFIGLAGLLESTGQPDGPPSIPGAPIADVSGALWAAIGVILALFSRKQTGKGQRVESTLLGGVIACMPVALTAFWGGQPSARGDGELTGGIVCYNVYETEEGKHVTLAALEPAFWSAFCTTVKRQDLLERQFAPARSGEPAYDELCTLFLSRTCREWEETFLELDACCEPVLTLQDALESAPVEGLGMISGENLLPPLRLAAHDIRIGNRAPSLGQHTASILRGLGYDDPALTEMKRRGIV